MDGTIWVAPADNPEVHGTNATLSAPVGAQVDPSQAWTLTLSNIPAHTLVTQSGFNVAVYEQQDDGCGGSCCGGSCCGGSCGGGCGGSSGNDTFSFTLSLNGQTVGQLSFDQSDASWTGSDDAGDSGWGGGFNPDSMPITDGGDSETWSITPNIPADDGYRHYVWSVSTGAVSAGTVVWVNNVQDAYRQTPPQPGIVQFSRDIAIAHDQTVYYTIGGTAVPGVQNADGTYSPADADYTGGTPVPGYDDLYSVTIPAGSDSAQVQFTPIVPYHFYENSEKSINVVLSVDANAPENVIAEDAPGTATKPAATLGNLHPLSIDTQDLPTEMDDGQIRNLVDDFNDPNAGVRQRAIGTLVSGLQDFPAGHSLSLLLDLQDENKNNPEVFSDINTVMNRVWGYGEMTFVSDPNGNQAVDIEGISYPLIPAGCSTIEWFISSTGSSISYYFGGPGGGPLDASTDFDAPPPFIYFNVKNSGVTTLTVSMTFYDVNFDQIPDTRGEDVETFIMACNVVQL